MVTKSTKTFDSFNKWMAISKATFWIISVIVSLAFAYSNLTYQININEKALTELVIDFDKHKTDHITFEDKVTIKLDKIIAEITDMKINISINNEVTKNEINIIKRDVQELKSTLKKR